MAPDAVVDVQYSCSARQKAPNTAPLGENTLGDAARRAPDPRNERRGHGGGSCAHALRAVRQFAWLEVGSGKVALSRPTHQRVTHTVGRLRVIQIP